MVLLYHRKRLADVDHRRIAEPLAQSVNGVSFFRDCAGMTMLFQNRHPRPPANKPVHGPIGLWPGVMIAAALGGLSVAHAAGVTPAGPPEATLAKHPPTGMVPYDKPTFRAG